MRREPTVRRQRFLNYAVAFIIVFNIAGWALVAATAVRTQREIIQRDEQREIDTLCSDHAQAIALRQIARELGLPGDIRIPDLNGVDCDA